MSARRRGRRGRAALGAGTLVAALLGCGERPEPEAPAAPPPDQTVVPARLFARIDTTLAFAVEQGQLAALHATDVGLRAFAVQQVARYEELRRQLQEVARGLGAPPPSGGGAAVRHGGRLGALRVARGAQFDHAYVQQALLVHQDLLADLDAALRLAEDVEMRRALERLRGVVGSNASSDRVAP